jgi:hypothetical protein
MPESGLSPRDLSSGIKAFKIASSKDGLMRDCSSIAWVILLGNLFIEPIFKLFIRFFYN